MSSPGSRRAFVIGVVALTMAAGLLPGVAAAANQPGELRAWGLNIYGQLGDGTTTAHGPGPVSGVTDATDLHGGRGHVVALRSTGTVLAWGQNNYGQVGDGTITSRSLPTSVSGLTGVLEVATGHYHSMALLADGTVRTWGYNASGQLGDGSTTNRRTPVPVSGLTSVVHIAGGRDMSYAVRSDGTVWAWGLNSDGELGDGTRTNRTTPVRVGSLTGVTAIAGGRDHGLAVLSDGTVWAWGDNAYGQIGDNSLTDRLVPVQVSGLTNITLVGAGAHHSYALRAEGAVFSWGRNNLGQLGDGSLTGRRTPVPVNGLGSSVTFVGSGRDHGLAVMADGTVRAWGRNDFRQLADGTTTNRTSPIVVPGVSGAQEVHGGQDYSIASVVTGPPDTTPPTQPGTPTGVSNSPSTISLTWAASDDDVSTSLRYDVYRGGAPAGSVTSASTSTVAFTDVGLAPASTHTYHVIAVDAGLNESLPSDESAPIVVQTAPSSIFSDDFSSGGFSNWNSVTRLTIDPAIGSPAAPSARAAPVNQTAFATKALGATYSNACLSMDVNVANQGGNIVVLGRVRTAADGPIARLMVNASGLLAIKSDVSNVTRTSAVALGTGWHRVEMCGTVGTSGAWDVYRDGVRIVNSWVANTGTLGIGFFNIGDTSAKTWTVNFDQIVVDQTPG
jgi:alpha-tubulin suppressor-like RCC1 family protein